MFIVVSVAFFNFNKKYLPCFFKNNFKSRKTLLFGKYNKKIKELWGNIKKIKIKGIKKVKENVNKYIPGYTFKISLTR